MHSYAAEACKIQGLPQMSGLYTDCYCCIPLTRCLVKRYWQFEYISK